MTIIDQYKKFLRSEDEDTLAETVRKLKESETAISGLESDFRYAIETEIVSARQAAIQLTEEKNQLFVQLTDLIETLKKETDQMDSQLNSIRQELSNREIASPIDGKVSVVADIGEGEYIQAGVHVLTVVPRDGSEFNVQLAVSNRDIAQIHPGDVVKLHLQAYPSSQYGVVSGNVTSINADASVDSQTGASYYLAIASVNMESIQTTAKDPIRLQAGMTAEASIVTSNKRIGQWLLEKLDLWSK